MTRPTLLLVVALMPIVARGQDAVAPAATVTFEVASVKENRSGAVEGAEGDRLGAYVATNVPLRLLIQRAYGVGQEQLIGGPSWVSSPRFDVDARLPSGAEQDDFPLMLRTLLSDRFKLRLRHEIRQARVYALAVERPDGRLGPRFTRSSTRCRTDTPVNPCLMSGRFVRGGGNLKGVGQSLAQLTAQLTKAVDRPVVDRTQLEGTFD